MSDINNHLKTSLQEVVSSINTPKMGLDHIIAPIDNIHEVFSNSQCVHYPNITRKVVTELSGKWAWESDAGYKKRMEEENNESQKRLARALEKSQKDAQDFYDNQMSLSGTTAAQRNSSSQNNQSGGIFDLIKFLVLLPIGLAKIVYRHVLSTYERALELSNHKLLITFLMLFTPLVLCVVTEIVISTISLFSAKELSISLFVILPILLSSIAMASWVVAKRYPIRHTNIGYVLRSIVKFITFSVLSWVVSLIILMFLF